MLTRRKRRRTNRTSSSQVDDEGDDNRVGGDARPSQSQPPLSKARMKEDLVAVRRRLGHSFPNTTPVPPSTSLEVEMLHRQLPQEKRKGLARDRLMAKMWKAIKVIFSCVGPDREIP
ncbi:hypothetical protein KY285_012639 [Solanum tuberosum]|nr:hypothetical protein KY285_012639 [Solanum tuberosum]